MAVSPPSRRGFLHTSVAVGAASLILPTVQAAKDSERLLVGIIGCGQRGTTLAREVVRLKHLVVAICDVAEFRVAQLQKDLALTGQDDKPTEYSDYRRLLEHRGLDAVMIATPDHHHRNQLVAACILGKDVYCEAPLTKSLEEGKEMIEAVRKNKRIVQVGHQRRSGAHWKRCREIIDSNDFGNLVWAKAWDCRNWMEKDPYAVPAKFDKEMEKQIDWEGFQGKELKREFKPERYWAWRWFLDYSGGLMTDFGSHHLDLLQWLSGAEAPKSVVTHGWKYQFKDWETPDVVHGVWDYGKFSATFDAQCINGAEGTGIAFYGTKMTLVVDAHKEVRVYGTNDRITADTVPAQKWAVESETAAHVKNWLDCCITRKSPNCPIELGQRAAVPVHLANLAYRSGKKAYWDVDKQEVIGG